MESFYINNVRGAIIHDTRRHKKADDDSLPANGKKSPVKYYPVRFRITHERKQIYFNAGYDLTINDWEQLPKTRIVSLMEIRKGIQAGFKRLEKAVGEICINDEYSNEKLTTYIKKGRKHGVSAAFENKIMELEKNGQSGTAMIYTCAKAFIEKDYPSLKFAQVTKPWLEKFERKSIEGGLTYSTLSIYLRCLRALFNQAIQAQTIKDGYYPFTRTEGEKNKYQIKEGSGTKTALTPQQILKIVGFTPETRGMERSRDLFLLSFHLGGINFKDLLLLKWEHIVSGEIIYTREKTKSTNRKTTKISIPVTTPAEDIIYKWGNLDHEYILPFMKPDPSPSDIRRITQNITRKVNLHLGLIGKEIGIPGLSTMVARHSFATILKNAGVPIAFISETLGHRSLTTTANYLKGFEKEQRAKHFEALTMTNTNGNGQNGEN
jgi:integrase/recombinase XerD